jgi:peptide chain release factor subunit 1
MVQHLRLFGNTVPNHGIALFSGNVSEREGFDDFRVWSIVPPKPIHTKVYLCEQKFFLEPLEEMLESDDIYGLIVIERGGASIGMLRGKHMDLVKDIRSMVPGKFRAGGQSANRLARVIDGMAEDFYKKVGEDASAVFTTTPHLKGIIVGGAGQTKESFISAGHLHYTLRDKILAVKDVSTDGFEGLQELVNRSKDVLADAAVTHEKEVVDKFLEALAKDGPVAYGEEEVRRAVELNAVETLLLSEDLEEVRVDLECDSCHCAESRTVNNIEKFRSDAKAMKCPKCTSPTFNIKSEKDMIEELAEKAKELGARVEFVSTETNEGQQLFRFGGIAAMLRYKLQ